MKTSLFTCFLLFGCLDFWGQTHIELARKSMAEQDYTAAIEHLLNDSCKLNKSCLSELAYCYSLSGNHVEAKRYWLQLEEEEQFKINANYYLADIAHSEGNVQEAVDRYFRLTEWKPDNVFYQKKFASLCLEMGLDTLAILHFEKALNLYPSDMEGILSLAGIYLRLKDFDRAGNRIAYGLNVNPNHLKLKLLEIETCYSDRFYTQTNDLINDYYKYSEPTNYLRRMNYISHIQLKEYNEALEVILSLEEPDNNKENTYFYKYKSYLGLEDHSQARLWLEKAIEEGRNKEEAQYHGLLGNLFIDMEFYLQAAKNYLLAYDRNKDPNLLYWAARSYDAAKKYENAHIYYRMFLREHREQQFEVEEEILRFSSEREAKLKEWVTGN